MKPQFLIFTILIWAILSCCDNIYEAKNVFETETFEPLSSDDYNIINAIFPHLVISSPPGTNREFGYENYNPKDRKIPDAYFRKVYFTNVLVLLNDTVVFNLRPNERLNIDDSSVQKLYKRLFLTDPIDLIIEMDSITNTGLSKLTPVRKGQKFDREISQMFISYSTISYNPDNQKQSCTSKMYVQDCVGSESSL